MWDTESASRLLKILSKALVGNGKGFLVLAHCHEPLVLAKRSAYSLVKAMEVLVATLCDAANDYNGKLCLMGCFDTICAQQLPVVHPQCSLALRICFRSDDEGHHQFQIAFIDDDGKPVMPPFEPKIEVAFPGDSFFVTRNLVLNIQRLQFQNPGQYSIDIQANGNMITRIPLRVLKVEPKEGAEGGIENP